MKKEREFYKTVYTITIISDHILPEKLGSELMEDLHGEGKSYLNSTVLEVRTVGSEHITPREAAGEILEMGQDPGLLYLDGFGDEETE